MDRVKPLPKSRLFLSIAVVLHSFSTLFNHLLFFYDYIPLLPQSTMSPSAVHPDGAIDGSTLNAKAATFEPFTNAGSDKYHASSTQAAISAEAEYAAHNYHPLPIVFSRALGCLVWDPEGKQYLDFLSAYSAVNQGHCHPKLVQALVDQASRLTLSSRAFYNDVFPRFAETVTKTLGFEMVMPMNTGAEAVETAVKIARKWGYKVKGIPQIKALVFSAQENFHGRTVSVPRVSCIPITDH